MRSLSNAFDATTLFKKVSKLKGVLVLDGENNDDDGAVMVIVFQNGCQVKTCCCKNAQNRFFSIQSPKSEFWTSKKFVLECFFWFNQLIFLDLGSRGQALTRWLCQ